MNVWTSDSSVPTESFEGTLKSKGEWERGNQAGLLKQQDQTERVSQRNTQILPTGRPVETTRSDKWDNMRWERHRHRADGGDRAQRAHSHVLPTHTATYLSFLRRESARSWAHREDTATYSHMLSFYTASLVSARYTQGRANRAESNRLCRLVLVMP